MMIEQVQGFRLSPRQKSLWSRQQGQGFRRACCRITLDGSLNVAHLHHALRRVVQRHEILRTTYRRIPGIKMPLQCIDDADATVSWSYVNLDMLEWEKQEARMEQIFYGEIFAPGDLEQQLPLRAVLVTNAAHRHTLFIITPALNADSWTFKNLLHELEIFYQQNEADQADEETVQYTQFTDWHYEILEDEEQASQAKAYWLHQGESASWSAKLPGESRVYASDNIEPHMVRSEPGVELVRQIETLLSEQSISASAFFLACWHILLWRLTGESSIAVDTVFTGRKYEELLEASGLYAQTIPTRSSFSGKESFLATLRKFATLLRDMEEWQEYFIAEIEEQSDKDAAMPVSFEFVEWDAPHVSNGVTFAMHSQYTSMEPFKIKLSCIRQGQTLLTEFLYNAHGFSVESMQRLADQFLSLLQSVVAQPEIIISQIEILSPAERQRLLIDQNNTWRDYPPDQCIQQLFEQQAARVPDRVVVLSGDQQLTYNELNARANQLAHYLQASGVGADTLVALSLERSPEMVIGVLGILKSGGAYVPLDTKYPQARRTFILEDVNATLVVTMGGLASGLAEHKVSPICLDGDWPIIARKSKENPPCITDPEQLAYVIYTSGSTGRPKGSMIPHRGLTNYLLWCSEAYKMDEGQGTIVHSSIGFDLTITSLFSPLIRGQQILLLPEAQGVEALADALRDGQDFSLVKVTPAHLEALRHVLPAEHLNQRVRTLVIGGEALFYDQLTCWRNNAPTTRLINEYGPTETVVGCCVYEVSPHDTQTGPVAIGKPITNMQMYILDPFLQPVPVGVVGELYIGGYGITRGYLKRADLTAEHFVPHPFSQESGLRLYRTGDLGCYRADGQIEYVGRLDSQVKIRGNRVEPGEIEAVLREHSDVQDTVVMMREDTPGNPQLAAYVIPQRQSAFFELPEKEDLLKKYVRQMLPEYMVPSSFELLEAFPLTSNGKVDRAALPAPGQKRHSDPKTFAAPQTLTEQSLVHIWTQVLGIRNIGIHHSFFESGGHSMLATQLISRIRSIFHVDLPLSAIFDAPTIAEFALKLEEALRQKGGMAALPIRSQVRGKVIPLSFAQQRLWFLHQLEPDSNAYLIPSAQRVHGLIDRVALERSIQEIVHRHESLRTTFQVRDNLPFQVIHPPERFHLPFVDLRTLSPGEREEQARLIARQEARHPCDLTQGPLLRVFLLGLEDQEHVLLITLHHIVSDGWSMQVFERELSALYQAFAAGEESPLAPLPIQYADYALWQRQWLQGEALEAQLAYWRQQLQGAPPLELFTDHPRPAVQSHRGAQEIFHLPLSLYDELLALSQQEEVTLFMLLLASFVLLLSRYSDQYDISVGTPIANRTQTELEGLIGFFVNTLVMRVDLSGNPSFVELLRRVREVALGAYTHQDVPFESLVEILQPERDLSRSPLFQVMFTMQHGEVVRSDSTGRYTQELTFDELDLGHEASKFDLTFSIISGSQHLSCGVEYNVDLFEASTIHRLLANWHTLLAGIIADPARCILDLPLLTEADQFRLQRAWNDTARPLAEEICLHQLIERQAALTPHAPAVEYAGTALTYRRLNGEANRLARFLCQRGVQPGDLVGLAARRSLDMLVGVLAILKAGAAYVPLDPEYPEDRLAFLIADSGLKLLLMGDELLPAFSSLPTAVERVSFAQARTNTSEDMSDLSLAIPLVSPAYVIYTSGSTGRPKGVIISHRNLLFSTMARMAYYQEPARSFALLSSISFDSSVAGIFWTLCQGGKLLIPVEAAMHDIRELVRWLLETACTHLLCVPTLYALLLQQAEARALEALQVSIVAGETCPGSLARLHQQAVPEAELYNEYGPTEATVWSSVAHWQEQQIGPSVPIGYPTANTQIYILDALWRMVPQGVPGELYIGGAGIAWGYGGRPELTADRFVPDPFSEQPGQRLYRTGDRGRYREDGQIEYLGRLDQQVKLRGYRIEPGEIEARLQEHATVRECAVVIHEQRMLVAYVSLTDAGASLDAIKEHAKTCLPIYMQPAIWMTLADLPLTPNGKVDRRKLPAPQVQQEEQDRPRPARHPIEELILQAWSQVLGRDLHSVQANFFEQGGHSLLVMQVVGRLNDLLQLDLPLRSVFEAPTVEALARYVLDQSRHTHPASRPPLVAAPRPDRLPLSFAQQRLWFLDQLEPDSVVYLIPNAWSIQGKLERATLQWSLQELYCRHESLRTAFRADDGQPVQVVHPPGSFALHLIDIRSLEKGQRQKEARRLADQEAQQPFSLAQGPLWRAWLVLLAPEEHLLLVTFHHIIADAWSIDVFRRELSACYQAFLTDSPSPLAPLPIQYADYALWQRQWLQGERLEAQRNYWQQQLAGVPPLNLATDYPRPRLKTYHGAAQTLLLTPTLREALLALSRQEGVTLFMLLLAAFQVLLSRYSGQEDIAVGTPLANRTRQESEGLIGFFINTLVMRSNLAANPPFVELLRQVREVALAAYMHQDVPFEQLVEDLQPERDLSRSALFQVMFNLQQMPDETMESLEGLTLNELPGGQDTTKFDLTLAVTSGRSGLYCVMSYNTDCFAQPTIARMLEHWEILLNGIVNTPKQHVADLPLLTQAERHQQLIEWNSTMRTAPADQCLHEVFEAQVERTPDTVALVCEEGQLTYLALNQRANRLAHWICGQFSDLETAVGIYLERSLHLLVAVLGVLKAGGMYVPLDTTLPAERLNFLLIDTRMPLVLTQRSLLPQLAAQDCSWLCLDADWEQLSQEPEENVNRPLSSANAAYLLYTSGSTGTPKGVVVEHRQLMNYIQALRERVGLIAPANYAMVQPLTVDSCLSMLFPALHTGATLHLLTKECTLDPNRLAAYARKCPYDYLKIAPTHLAALLSEVPPQSLLPRRALIIGGEASQWQWVRQLRSELADGQLYNHYGPTETTVGSLMYQVQAEGIHDASPFTPLGTPLANTQIYVLDRQFQLVPTGVVGELYIGGLGQARGYLNRADLTAERFVPNPFHPQAGSRMYRTGDMVRYRADGTLEFVGRGDEQVKIRGYRVELGEISAVLRACADVREAVVLAGEDAAGQPALVAYVVAHEGSKPSSQTVQRWMRKKLPEYMVPSTIYWLEALPLTPHGKVDRKALARLAKVEEDQPEKYLPLHHPLEELVMEIWKQVLDRDQIDLHSTFFELGGHSLLAVQVITRIRSAFQLELPLSSLFEAPTLYSFSRRLQQALQAGQGIEMPALVPADRSHPLPLSFAQQRLWFLDQLHPENIAYLIPNAWRLHGDIKRKALQQALKALFDRHESLRTTFQISQSAGPLVQAGQPVQVIHPTFSFSLPLIDLSRLDPAKRERESERLSAQEARIPFNLTRDLLLRSYLVYTQAQEHYLLLTLHHIISDGWSMRVLVNDMLALYQAFVMERPSPLPPLPLQYADFAVWQRQWLQGKVLEDQLAYWRRRLAGAPAIKLPLDRPRPAQQSYRGGLHPFAFPGELLRQIVELSHTEGVTLFMLLLAAFKVMLYRYTGQEDIVIGTDSANRNFAETELIIGFFINILVLRTDLSGRPTFREVLRRIRETVLGASMHQEAPFELLVEKLASQHSLDRTPLVQTLFVQQNLPALQTRGEAILAPQEERLEASMYSQAAGEQTVKFDLVVFVREDEAGLSGAVNYSIDLFDPATIETMVARFEALLQSIVQQPDLPIDLLDFFTPAERARVEAQKIQKTRRAKRLRTSTWVDLTDTNE